MMKEEGTCKDGKLNGKSTVWYENGQKKFEETYKDDKIDGKWIYYNDDGTEKKSRSILTPTQSDRMKE
jgi:antitoxin component YwqK of YwqJK toxin-antitoxin module